MRRNSLLAGLIFLAVASGGTVAQDIPLERPLARAATDFDTGELSPTVDTRGKWTRDDLQNPTHWRWMWSGIRLRTIEFRSERGPAASMPAEVEWMHGYWTGDAWYSYSELEQSCVIDTRPHINRFNDVLGMFNRLDWPIIAAPEGLRKALLHDRVLSDETVRGQRRLRIASGDGVAPTMTVVCDINENRLDEVLIEFWKPVDGGDPQLTARVHYYVVEWMTIDEQTVPRRAVREATIFMSDRLQATHDKPHVQRLGIVRRSIDLSDAGERAEVFAPPRGVPGMAVIDKRSRISYHIGQDTIVVDGELRMTKTIDRIIQPDELASVLKESK